MTVNREELKDKLFSMKQLTQKELKDSIPKKYGVELVNECLESDPDKIKPILISVDSKSKYWKEWKAIEEHVSSFAFRRSPGRNCYFLIKNEYDRTNLGILDVAADFIALSPRDNHIGWDKDNKVLRNRNIANISVCVPTRHFGYNLTGGKLLSLLATSNQVYNHWKEKFGDELCGLTVTSLYGKSVQYNRLMNFKYLGLTKGQGTTQIPNELYKEMRLVVEEEEGEIPGGRFTKGKNSRINIIRRACKHLKFNATNLTTHGIQRGIYWCDRGENTSEYLSGVEKTFKPYDWSVDVLTEHWRERWAKKRIINLKNRI